MTSIWQPSTIGDLGGEIQTGPFGTTLKASEYSAEGAPVISVGEVKLGRLEISDKTPRVPQPVIERLPQFLLREGDIVFGRKGAVERSARVKREEEGWFLGSDGIRLRLPEGIDSRFIGYQLLTKSHMKWMIQHSAGSTMRSLNRDIISRIPVVLPPLPEQQAIADILGALDDKIELNRRMNATLDELARTIFRSWFVDFDPVRAKMEGREPFGMDAETAALFPDRLVDSPMGPIPEGWEVKPLDEIADFLNGLALQKFPPRNETNDLPVIKIAQLRANSTTGASTANDDVPEKYVIEDGDFLFSWSGSLLAAIWSGGPGALNQHLFKVTSEDYPQWFVYYWVHDHLDQFRAIAADKATTMGHINRRHLSEALCAVPKSRATLDAGERDIGDLMRLALANSLESRTLAELRDTLLPELISGRIRVPKAVQVIGEAV